MAALPVLLYAAPEIDYARFNIPYWQKFERMLRFARERNVIVSVIQDISTRFMPPSPGDYTYAVS